MIKIVAIVEEQGIREYLISRRLLERYKQAKDKLLISSRIRSLDFKLRKPTKDKVFSFRISNKWRAYGYYKDGIFIISKISDHQ